MKKFSSENPGTVEVFKDPFTGYWEVRPQKAGNGYGDLAEINIDCLTMIGHLDMQPDTTDRGDFLSSLSEQARQKELLEDLKRIMGTG
ncbi:hypothetical protein HZB78_00355 [Candidatus Collierbacteria bacterium]|nr:hypothetical protein [Candidatus Collierbacteria bacterium]